MRLLKSLAIITLSSLIGLSAHAETNKNKQPAKQQKTVKPQQPSKAQQPAKKQLSTKAPQQNVKQKRSPKAAPQLTSEQQLKRFTDSIALKFEGISINTQNNQKMVNFRYTLQNISKKSITRVEWLAVYFYNNTPILAQDVPVELKRLAPKKLQNLVFSLPFENLSPAAQQVFSNPQSEVAIQFQAKSITFSDKSKIVVK